MSGGPDPLYIRGRTVLIDAADALTEQFDALVLVGAQVVSPASRVLGRAGRQADGG